MKTLIVLYCTDKPARIQLYLHLCFSYMQKSRFSHKSNQIIKIEPRYEKTGFLHMRKQRRRKALLEADQRLCFLYMDSTIPLLPKYEISSL